MAEETSLKRRVFSRLESHPNAEVAIEVLIGERDDDIFTILDALKDEKKFDAAVRGLIERAKARATLVHVAKAAMDGYIASQGGNSPGMANKE